MEATGIWLFFAIAISLVYVVPKHHDKNTELDL